VKAATQLRRSKAYVVILVALALGACAPLAQVRQTKATLSGQHATSPELRGAEEAITVGQKLQRGDPQKAIGYYLRGVELAEKELQKSPTNSLALRDYDFALSRVFSVIRDAHLQPWTRPLHVPAPDDREYVVTQGRTPNPLWRPEYFDLIPADELDVRGKFVAPRVTRIGAGAALVAVREPQAPEIRQRFIPPRIYLAVTAVAHFREHKCEIEFLNPLALETTSISGHTLPSQADFTAPLALGLAQERPERFGVPALLDPERFADKAGLIQVQPYDPTKIPALLVHGLQDTPVAWTPMVNAFWADPAIRRNYQVWVFGYPTGYPIPYSALLLRRQLDVLGKAYPNHRGIVLIGHSMGGILSRLMISDSGGDKLWRYFFSKSPAETDLSPATKALLKEALIFKPRRDIARVIFISTPHRGSMIAQNLIGRFASSLIHKPTQFVRMGSETFQQVTVQQEDRAVMKLNRMPNSIDTLSPNDAFVKAMNKLSLDKSRPYHSIIGDRGRGDTPKSSDGVVPYWSSHLDGAESEKIVPSGHGAEHSLQGIVEVLRILHEHIASRGSGNQPRRDLRRTAIQYDSPYANRNRSDLTD
jgi:pimeloyl-ACP methyl ester carboxylesterase